MHKVPSICNTTKTAHAMQNDEYVKYAPNVKEYNIPITMKSWNIVPSRPKKNTINLHSVESEVDTILI